MSNRASVKRKSNSVSISLDDIIAKKCMKVVVTILQCKRVALPYIFLKYALPAMRDLCDFEIEPYLIQHIGIDSSDGHLETNRLPNTKLDLVAEWTQSGKYSNAIIIQHNTTFSKYPSLPSVRIGVETAIETKADFHLWLEDDALIFDTHCGDWPNIMGGSFLGVYHAKKEGYVNSAYLLSSIKFDELLLPALQDQTQWDISESMYHNVNGQRMLNIHSKRLEPTIARYSRNRWALLNSDFAARINPNKNQSSVNLYRLVKSLAPESLSLLELDFDKEYLNYIKRNL